MQAKLHALNTLFLVGILFSLFYLIGMTSYHFQEENKNVVRMSCVDEDDGFIEVAPVASELPPDQELKNQFMNPDKGLW